MKKIPGKMYTFKRTKDGATDRGRLPTEYGESNLFACWNSDSRAAQSGFWVSRKFKNEKIRETAKRARRGEASTGVFGRFCRIKAQSKYDCMRRGSGVPILSSLEEMKKIWDEQKGLCVCGEPLSLVEAHADHDHNTGKVRAFMHSTCNVIEGLLNKKTREQITRLLYWFWSQR